MGELKGEAAAIDEILDIIATIDSERMYNVIN